MLDQALAAIAASGGTAVVAAAGTDAWTGLRARLARWFGRGSEHRETVTLERLDATGAELEAAPAAELEAVRARAGAVWESRIRDLLEDLAADEREAAARQLRELLAELPAQRTQVTARDGGVAAGRDVVVRAEGPGTVAAAVIRGDVHVGRPESPNPPSPPDASQG
ncbi:MAG: hypothetical protein HOY69_10170 [Streptomyces sp.]|nr:hypothetical protein [Streptomyces sp.]